MPCVDKIESVILQPTQDSCDILNILVLLHKFTPNIDQQDPMTKMVTLYNICRTKHITG